jgi:thiol peroxidase
MATTKLKGNEVHTKGELPATGSRAPDFALTSPTLEDVSLASFAGKKKIISTNPSLDTGVCAATARGFNQRVAGRADVVVLVVTADLPFAQKRFCQAEGIENVVTLSEMRDRSFGDAYGLTLSDGPLRGLLARAVVVLDENDRVVHTELVPEITTEPDYDAALAALG